MNQRLPSPARTNRKSHRAASKRLPVDQSYQIDVGAVTHWDKDQSTLLRQPLHRGELTNVALLSWSHPRTDHGSTVPELPHSKQSFSLLKA
jgi:hypothetical protein